MAAQGDGSTFPSLSRDATRQAYATANLRWHIRRYPLAGAAGAIPVPFAYSTAMDSCPGPSPDGTRVAFVSSRASTADIWIADTSGTNLRRLTSLGNRWAHRPRWPSDGKELAYYAQSEDGRYRVFLINIQGGIPRRLTNREPDESQRSWSRDGKWVYFWSRGKSGGATQVWKAPAAGGAAVQVTRSGGLKPVESPDGKFLYYATSNDRRIVKAPVDGGEASLVVEKAARALWALVPAGIYLLEPDAKPKPVIEFFRFAGGRKTLVLSLPKGPEDYVWGSPSTIAVSPDGRSLYYEERDKPEGDIMLVENFR